MKKGKERREQDEDGQLSGMEDDGCHVLCFLLSRWGAVACTYWTVAGRDGVTKSASPRSHLVVAIR